MPTPRHLLLAAVIALVALLASGCGSEDGERLADQGRERAE